MVHKKTIRFEFCIQTPWKLSFKASTERCKVFCERIGSSGGSIFAKPIVYKYLKPLKAKANASQLHWVPLQTIGQLSKFSLLFEIAFKLSTWTEVEALISFKLHAQMRNKFQNKKRILLRRNFVEYGRTFPDLLHSYITYCFLFSKINALLASENNSVSAFLKQNILIFASTKRLFFASWNSWCLNWGPMFVSLCSRKAQPGPWIKVLKARKYPNLSAGESPVESVWIYSYHSTFTTTHLYIASLRQQRKITIFRFSNANKHHQSLQTFVLLTSFPLS